MGLLPDINEDGTLAEDTTPKLYQPKEMHVEFFHKDRELVRNDRKGTKFKDAPTMADMHECVPDDNYECFTCGREMIV